MASCTCEFSRSRRQCGNSARSGWVNVCAPNSCPSRTIRRASSGLRATWEPTTKNVAGTRCPGTPVPALSDPDLARTWLDTERACLLAIARHTAGHGWPAPTVKLSTILFRYLDSGHFTDALTIHGHARDAARESGDPAGQAQALTGLGAANGHMTCYDTAATQFEQALVLFRQAGDRTGEARALANLGVIEQSLGRYQAAADHHELALALYRQAGDRD